MAARPSDLTAVRENSKIRADTSKGHPLETARSSNCGPFSFCRAIDVAPGLAGCGTSRYFMAHLQTQCRRRLWMVALGRPLSAAWNAPVA